MKNKKRTMTRISAIIGTITGGLTTLLMIIFLGMSSLIAFIFMGEVFLLCAVPLFIGITITVIDAIRCGKCGKGLTITSLVLNIIIFVFLIAFLSVFLEPMGDNGPVFLFFFPLFTAITTVVLNIIALCLKAPVEKNTTKTVK